MDVIGDGVGLIMMLIKTTTNLSFLCFLDMDVFFLRGIILLWVCIPLYMSGCVDVICMLFQYFRGLVKKFWLMSCVLLCFLSVPGTCYSIFCF